MVSMDVTLYNLIVRYNHFEGIRITGFLDKVLNHSNPLSYIPLSEHIRIQIVVLKPMRRIRNWTSVT
jgi:hypothetical protein